MSTIETQHRSTKLYSSSIYIKIDKNSFEAITHFLLLIKFKFNNTPRIITLEILIILWHFLIRLFFSSMDWLKATFPCPVGLYIGYLKIILVSDFMLKVFGSCIRCIMKLCLNLYAEKFYSDLTMIKLKNISIDMIRDHCFDFPVWIRLLHHQCYI